MKHLFTLVTAFVLYYPSFAQQFLPGEVVMTNQKILNGTIAVDYATNTVIVQQEEKKFIYHASVIEQVITINGLRQLTIYKTFDHKSKGLFDRWERKFFEIVTFGKISLVKRGIDFADEEDGDGYTMYDWYLLEQGHLKEIRNFKKDVLPKMAGHLEEMETFINENNLWNLRNGDHIYQLVSYYNRLSQRLELTNPNGSI